VISSALSECGMMDGLVAIAFLERLRAESFVDDVEVIPGDLIQSEVPVSVLLTEEFVLANEEFLDETKVLIILTNHNEKHFQIYYQG